MIPTQSLAIVPLLAYGGCLTGRPELEPRVWVPLELGLNCEEEPELDMTPEWELPHVEGTVEGVGVEGGQGPEVSRAIVERLHPLKLIH